jgi:hypothetical protein
MHARVRTYTRTPRQRTRACTYHVNLLKQPLQLRLQRFARLPQRLRRPNRLRCTDGLLLRRHHRRLEQRLHLQGGHSLRRHELHLRA